ncbi:ABC1 kinase family protein [Jannaschia seohaensis]|uniref:Predicted unusual protein kinase regulating ubiquinone biosynthesis, AarF/ABC1/UbiB family n=1 Tax=Jannaschia seohaensis TaxID=475081 RepID=A0A2Y9ANV2_9RHOB|nr:AarF/ABC1/UbiB kinase family protein [Jannaschia seohaensis]PWJ19117.1 putative unusual protein kinase regulating ubiquinone biosynthesis (AarF/ABC1/UbiB family) [Jannaschia seohaensis]SSA45756.1 Predicted unusual protein kinase regulating ubiquinone biosynthesis, AarF/ABC1/UbiB family [Jannaschia seohaensis]
MTDRPDFGRPVAVPSGRFTRMGRLGRMTLGVAGSMAAGGAGELLRGRRPARRDLLLTPGNLRRVADELARMRGAAMKMGQLLSMDTGEMLPPELSEIMARLRAEADFMPPAQLKKVLAAEWPRDWLRHFARFDVRPIAAASIGQVHRAQLKDGRDVAVKVQYPGVAGSIDSDVANVAALVRMSGLIPAGFDLVPYVEEARLQLHAETDYEAEGAHMARFAELLSGDDRFAVPQRHDNWTTPRILAMSYLDSRPLETLETAPQAERDAVATALLDLLFRELFDFALMQTDPNLANYRYDPERSRIVLLDFGATRALSETTVAQYRDLMRAGLSGDADAVREAAQAIGFLDETVTADHAARILSMMEMVFAPLRSGLYDFGDPALSRRLQAEGMALGENGFVPPPLPIDALFLQRKIAGLFLICAKLRARVDVAGLLRPHI